MRAGRTTRWCVGPVISLLTVVAAPKATHARAALRSAGVRGGGIGNTRELVIVSSADSTSLFDAPHRCSEDAVSPDNCAALASEMSTDWTAVMGISADVETFAAAALPILRHVRKVCALSGKRLSIVEQSSITSLERLGAVGLEYGRNVASGG